MSQQRVETGPATFGQFIGGTWRAAESGRGFDDMDLWSGDVVAQFAAGSGAERSRPASARTGGFRTWAHASPGLRQDIFVKVAEILARRRPEILHWLAVETEWGRDFGAIQLDFAQSLLSGSLTPRTPPSVR